MRRTRSAGGGALVTSDLEGIVRTAIGEAPLARLLGVRVEVVEPELVRVRLPFRAEVTTIGDMVHGGAISALVDVAATAAAWTGADLARQRRGTTIGLTVSFLAGARGGDVLATARVIQRGRAIVVCEVDVADGDGAAVARALVTYKLDHRER
jgi:uncharacterized protein (TIGR00369 family)